MPRGRWSPFAGHAEALQVLERDFSTESGELTAKLSVKRKVVNSKYGHIFDGFYEEKH